MPPMSYAFEDSSFWKNAFCQPVAGVSSGEQASLATELKRIRAKVEELVGYIAHDLPGYTKHDITHLDALWDLASLIAGPDIALNPSEAFVFGVAVLLHDAGMTLAAYPGGLVELARTTQWQDAQARLHTPDSPPPAGSHIEQQIAAETLRLLHAEKAQDLATMPWLVQGKPGVFLIEDTNLRRSYGTTIGTIAHSHWWPISRVEDELDRRLGAVLPCSSSSVDLLKLACLLRAADAAHLDKRRAPYFARVLAKPTGISALHWTFQEKLAAPMLDGDALVFTSCESFKVADSDAWWLAFDAMAMADRELRDTDRLLRDRRGLRVAARRVRGANDAEELSSFLRVDGWAPVDTRIRVSDVPAIVAVLGGEQLYGKDANAPLRELIQNARDAIDARRRLEQRDPGWGDAVVSVFERDGAVWLSVEDNGVGMSRSTLIGTLLDFGRSLWRSAEVTEQFPGLAAAGMNAVGRFGIGFFSVFMLGEEVNVITRRYDQGLEQGLCLQFKNGLRSRALLSSAPRGAAPVDGGTRVEIKLTHDPRTSRGLQFQLSSRIEDRDAEERLLAYWRNRGRTPAPLPAIVEWLAPSIDISLITNEFGRKDQPVTADDWTTIPVPDLSRRLRANRVPAHAVEKCLRLLKSNSGEVVGRAMAVPQQFEPQGVITVGGLRATSSSVIFGILKGRVENASRDKAQWVASSDTVREWASEQAVLLEDVGLSEEELADCASFILEVGGNCGKLPLAQFNDGWLNRASIRELLSSTTELVVSRDGLDYEDEDPCSKGDFDRHLKMKPDVLYIPRLLHRPKPDIEGFVYQIAIEVWNDVEVEYVWDYQVGTVHGVEIFRPVERWSKAGSPKDADV